jgi:hypothetical protein
MPLSAMPLRDFTQTPPAAVAGPMVKDPAKTAFLRQLGSDLAARRDARYKPRHLKPPMNVVHLSNQSH